MVRTSLLTLTVSLALCSLALPRAASAQRSLAYDTLSSDTPGAVSCGFCGGEKASVIYYDLGGGAGLQPSEFPLLVRELIVAVASASPGGTAAAPVCMIGTTPRDGLFDVAVYAGTTVPTAVAALPADGVWPGEMEVTSAIDLPLALSVSSSATMPMYSVNLLTIGLDAVGLRVDAPYTYLRVVLGIQPDAAVASSICAVGQGPSGLPMRDDAPIGDHRNLIYAGPPTSAWLWNEEAGIAGDWAIRLDVRPMGGGADGGVPVDAGPLADAGSVIEAGVEMDAGGGVDAGTGAPPPPAGEGCSCSAVGDGTKERRNSGFPPAGLWLSALFGSIAMGRLRRRR